MLGLSPDLVCPPALRDGGKRQYSVFGDTPCQSSDLYVVMFVESQCFRAPQSTIPRQFISVGKPAPRPAPRTNKSAPAFHGNFRLKTTHNCLWGDDSLIHLHLGALSTSLSTMRPIYVVGRMACSPCLFTQIRNKTFI